MSKIVSFKPEAPAAEAAAPDERASLRAQQDALEAELKRLNRVHEARPDVERRLAELDAEQASIDEASREAWHAWAATAEGPPPAPRTADREAIARRRVMLAGDLQSAQNGARAVEDRLAGVTAEIGQVRVALFRCSGSRARRRAGVAPPRGKGHRRRRPLQRPRERRPRARSPTRRSRRQVRLFANSAAEATSSTDRRDRSRSRSWLRGKLNGFQAVRHRRFPRVPLGPANSRAPAQAAAALAGNPSTARTGSCSRW